jgi:hypothetical protein
MGSPAEGPCQPLDLLGRAATAAVKMALPIVLVVAALFLALRG